MDELARHVVSLFDDLRRTADDLEKRHVVPVGRAIVEGGDTPGLTTDEKAVVGRARRALMHLADGGAASALAQEELEGLQFLLFVTARPALRVQGGRATGPFPREWEKPLQISSAFVENAIRAVVRIEVGNDHKGSGFAVSAGTVLTNKHVLKEIATVDGAGKWTLARDVTVDFVAEGAPPRARYRVSGVVAVHPSLDAAVLELHVAAPLEVPDGFDFPDRLLFAPKPCSHGITVVTVGCPGAPRAHEWYPPPMIYRLFDNTFGVKRVSPGRVLRVTPTEVVHDASTLGGSSGSAVVELEEGLVVGLHSNGRQDEENIAVPVSRSDAFFAAHVTFG